MTRIPALGRDEMNETQQRIHDEIVGTTGRIGRGPAIGYAYSPGMWRLHAASSAHLVDCALTTAQVRIVSLMTVRHWKAAYTWSAQAAMASDAGLGADVIEAINDGERPEFTDNNDAIVYGVAGELLETGTLGEEMFKTAEAAIGYAGLADVVCAIGHFCTTAMMANVVGAEPPPDAPSRLNA